MKHYRSLALVAALVLGLWGCNNTTTSGTPTSATSSVTENFTGTIAHGGTDTHRFTVGASGTVTLTLTAVSSGPSTTLAIGYGIGAWNPLNSTCTLIGQDTNARQGASMSGTLTAGSYCVQAWDVGNISADALATYTLQVVHP